MSGRGPIAHNKGAERVVRDAATRGYGGDGGWGSCTEGKVTPIRGPAARQPPTGSAAEPQTGETPPVRSVSVESCLPRWGSKRCGCASCLLSPQRESVPSRRRETGRWKRGGVATRHETPWPGSSIRARTRHLSSPLHVDSICSKRYIPVLQHTLRSARLSFETPLPVGFVCPRRRERTGTPPTQMVLHPTAAPVAVAQRCPSKLALDPSSLA